MGGLISGLFSLLTGRAPTVSNSAASTVRKEQSAAGALRASLYSTEGGASGQDLNNDQVQRRPTLMGN